MLDTNLLRFNKDQKFLLPDFETNNLNLFSTKPWQLSFITFDLNNNYEEHDYIIKWDDFKMSAGAAAVTGFNFVDYKNRGQDPKKILDIFESYLFDKQYRIVFHNGLGFDSMVYNVWRRELGLKPTYDYLYDREFACYDTLSLSKAFKKGYKPDLSNSNAFLAWQYKMLSIRLERGNKTNLGAMGKEFGIKFDEKDLHNALFDIRLNREVFRKLIWNMDI